jgi:hypothetical protein
MVAQLYGYTKNTELNKHLELMHVMTCQYFKKEKADKDRVSGL